jgi:dihydrofolate reductase
LLKNDLVDELWLKTFPVVLGTGKKLFADGAVPTRFSVEKTSVSPSGVVIATYKRGGEVKTGSF